MKSLKCATFTDSLIIVEVESTFIRGLPGFNIVGLANTTIKESESRVKAALLSLNFKFPPSKIVINLSPSDIPKQGSHFDLAIALLIALQKEKIDDSFFVFGELGLDGSIKSTASLFSILLFLSSQVKSARILVPEDIALKACMIPNFEVFAVRNLKDAMRFFIDKEFISSCLISQQHPLFENAIFIKNELYVPNLNFNLDFKDVKGQKRAKRASLIAACGMHNILFEGSPGCGKSMCAKRIHQILPPQSLKEVMLATAYESLNNKEVDFSAMRPFRSPHHTSTRSSIFGGGSGKAKIGEVALANGGELFFDELPHFSKQILESLREPLEDNKILISRVNSKTEYETKFIFVAAQNPCQINKNLSCLSFEPYGISKHALDYANLKLKNQKDYLKNSEFVSSTGQIRNLLDVSMSANFSSKYYAEVTNRVNTIQSFSFIDSLKPVFLTITLNGCFRKALFGDFSTFGPEDRKYLSSYLRLKLNRNEPFTIRDLVFHLNHCWNIFVKRLHTKYRGLQKNYIRTFEPHKKFGVPHIHCLLNIPDYAFDYAFKCFKDIFNAPQNLRNSALSNEQKKNGEINGFQWSLNNPTGYVLKYINKTFLNFEVDKELNNYSAWYVVNKVRRFITSRTPVPLWIYRKINFFEKDFYSLNDKFRSDYYNFVGEWDLEKKYFKFEDFSTHEVILYEDGVLTHSIKGVLLHQYSSGKSSNFDSSYKVKDKPISPYEIKRQRKKQYTFVSDIEWYLRPYSLMNDWQLYKFYSSDYKKIMNPQGLAILENEMLVRGLDVFTKKHEMHNLNDIDSLKSDFSFRGIQDLEF